MNLFWLLVLAHLVADFPLQTDRIFEYKNKSSRGVLLHILITISTTAVITLPYLKTPYFWLLLLLLAAIHFGLDKAKIEVTKRYLEDNILLFLFDQGLHISTIWVLAYKLYDFSMVEAREGLAYSFYFDNRLVMCLSGFVFTVFGSAPLIYYLRLFLHRLPGKENKDVGFPPIRSRLHGYVERLVSISGVFFGGWFLVIVPLAFLPRFFWPSNRARKDFISITVGVVLTVSIGILLRNYT